MEERSDEAGRRERRRLVAEGRFDQWEAAGGISGRCDRQDEKPMAAGGEVTKRLLLQSAVASPEPGGRGSLRSEVIRAPPVAGR